MLVVKLGGGAGFNMQAACDDLARIAQRRPLIVVHGVSDMANRLTQERGLEVRMITSPSGHTSRYTDEQTRDIYVEAAELVNQQIVSFLQAANVTAVGLVNDETVIHGKRKTAIRAVINGRVRMIRDDYSGSISGVDTARLNRLLNDNVVPILPPIALSEADGLLNVDGDRASAAIASAVSAGTLIILTNVRGLYRNFPDEHTFVSQISHNQIDEAMTWAQGRMKRKVVGTREALEGGVRQVILADGRVQNPVQRALDGEGTVFTS
ncbi:MAG: [LysW]-aminoadipate kinase [Chloroflexi bacterium]|nr:MAG: [LysW]-aminoadipate kinase [Chloroflexota bacterium]